MSAARFETVTVLPRRTRVYVWMALYGQAPAMFRYVRQVGQREVPVEALVARYANEYARSQTAAAQRNTAER